MSNLLSKPDPPKPAPPPIRRDDAALQAAGDRERRLRAGTRNRRSTVLTQGLAPNVGGKTLLGE